MNILENQTYLEVYQSKQRTKPLTMVFVGAALYAIGVILICMILFATTILCEVVGSSMEKNLYDGDYLLVNRFDTDYSRGKIVVFHSAIEDYDVVKRVIAVEGEAVKFVRSGDYMILLRREKGQTEFFEVTEDYINGRMLASYFNEHNLVTDIVEVDKNQLFVMGDNRNNSRDSRSPDVGCIQTSQVKGVMYYKLDRGSALEAIFLFLYPEPE